MEILAGTLCYVVVLAHGDYAMEPCCVYCMEVSIKIAHEDIMRRQSSAT